MSFRLGPHLWGHLLRFEPVPLAPYPAASGARLLLVVAVFEGLLGPRLHLLRWLGIEAAPAMSVRVPLLLVSVLVLVRWFAGVRPSQLGLRRLGVWSTGEKSYCAQVFLLANVIFAALFAKPVAALAKDSKLWPAGAVVLVTSVLWGFYQELIYRGLLQTELTRRFGPLGGILIANTLYTFGPLHFYHFAEGGPGAKAAMFGGIFAIGLFFSLLYRRSHNLWMAGLFHGLGDWYIVGVRSVVG